MVKQGLEAQTRLAESDWRTAEIEAECQEQGRGLARSREELEVLEQAIAESQDAHEVTLKKWVIRMGGIEDHGREEGLCAAE